MKKVILADIDHTISDAAHRDPMIGGEGGWDAYHAASEEDKPCDDMVAIIKVFQNDSYRVIGLTSRPEKWRALTNGWLLQHKIFLDELLMRPNNDFRTAPEVKLALAQKRFGESLARQTLCIIDDREDVVAAFKAIGITSLQVHNRCYGEKAND